MFFSCELPKDFDIKQLKIQESEVTSLDFYKITSEKEIENLPLAFGSAKVMLKKWFERAFRGQTIIERIQNGGTTGSACRVH